MITTNKSEFCSRLFFNLATLFLVLQLSPSAASEMTCAESVQGQIAWANKNTSWSTGNVTALCKGAENSTEPGKCFKRVTSGAVNYGGGVNWNPDNALKLCVGALDSDARISCFEGKVKSGIAWADATKQCVPTITPRANVGSITMLPVPESKPTTKSAKLPPKKPATPAPGCSPTGDCDGDGVSIADGDCDDNDSSRYPGAPERADFVGHDEDCDDTTFGIKDDDGDGFTDSRVCNGIRCGFDCDDTRPAVNPHAAELPNRRDDNCNGLIDDDLEGWWNPAN